MCDTNDVEVAEEKERWQIAVKNAVSEETDRRQIAVKNAVAEEKER